MDKELRKIIIINLFLLISYLFTIETVCYVGRFILRKPNVGFLLKIKKRPKELNDKCQHMISHPFLGYIHDPDSGCIVKNGKIKNDYIEYPKNKNYLNSVITLGGSTTDGFYNHYNKGITWSSALSNILDHNKYKYSILNGGVGGYSSSQETLKLLLGINNIQKKKNVKLIISLNGINELPQYNTSLWQEQNLPFWNEFHVKTIKYKKYIDLRGHDAFISPPNLIAFPAFLSFIDGFSRGKDFTKLNKYVSYGESYTNNIYKEKAAIWTRNVKLMNYIAKENNAKYLVFLQPTMGINKNQTPTKKSSLDYKVYKSALNKKIYINEKFISHYKFTAKLYDELKDSCKKLDFCIDISSVAPPDGNNYTDPRHHNENGNKIIAKAIFTTIKKYLK